MTVENAKYTEIITQPRSVSEQVARKRVMERPTARIKRLVFDQDLVRSELRYKPYYAFNVTLTKRVFRGEDQVTEGSIIVDALSGIARPFTTDAIETNCTTVPTTSVLTPSIEKSDARIEAKSRRMQVEHREHSTVEMEKEPRIVHKPIWLVELTDESVRAVDAVDGRVYGNMLIG